MHVFSWRVLRTAMIWGYRGAVEKGHSVEGSSLATRIQIRSLIRGVLLRWFVSNYTETVIQSYVEEKLDRSVGSFIRSRTVSHSATIAEGLFISPYKFQALDWRLHRQNCCLLVLHIPTQDPFNTVNPGTVHLGDGCNEYGPRLNNGEEKLYHTDGSIPK